MTFILTPCFNEENTIIPFLKQLEFVLQSLDDTFHVVVVDDCSQDNTLDLLSRFSFSAPNIYFDILHLKFNAGHQVAIYQGLLYIHARQPEQVIIMDSDGEDAPEAIPLILQKKNFAIVEVKRGKRSESFLFRASYFFYRMLFRLITGKVIDFGNYCMISGAIVDRIHHTSFTHFPAYLLKQKASRTSIIYNRGKRIDGKSKMGYKGLLLHAFRSMIEFAEDLLLVFFKMFIVIICLLVLVAANIIYQKFISQTAISGWFSTLAISLVTLGVLCLGFFIVGILLLNLLNQQNIKSFREIYYVVKKSQK